ncbi:hypothetical protein [Nitrosomonas sp. Is37]|uniref:hypothetical protein n=1 Tax=Nitrosomonas sp. Is37 TaxID=3080535 RepID=UPI00294AD689|nr:hypothetical protein [Nitrosomonas sp. Is37]MDV6343537.1 hypothetical protein [Nitrosomonas sp. Is37]
MSKLHSVIVGVGIFCLTLLYSIASSFSAQAAELRLCAYVTNFEGKKYQLLA